MSEVSDSHVRMAEPARNLMYDEFMKKLAMFVEATDNERHMLWKEHHDQVIWKQGGGYLVQVGQFAGMPVNFTLSFETINGKVIGFWSGISRVVHYGMIETWMDTHMKGLPRLSVSDWSPRDLR